MPGSEIIVPIMTARVCTEPAAFSAELFASGTVIITDAVGFAPTVLQDERPNT